MSSIIIADNNTIKNFITQDISIKDTTTQDKTNNKNNPIQYNEYLF